MKKKKILKKLQNRVTTYKINILNPIRENKKLLVLDIDYTIFDHRSTAEKPYELMRPYLFDFLSEAYQNYDIAIWSATSMKWIEIKMQELGVMKNPNFKIAFFLDSSAMITVSTAKYGVINVKPLGIIWSQIKQYHPKNTIMFDDLKRNFLMNPQNGLKIKPFKNAVISRSTDDELLRLIKYLNEISNVIDFTKLDHDKWEEYRKN